MECGNNTTKTFRGDDDYSTNNLEMNNFKWMDNFPVNNDETAISSSSKRKRNDINEFINREEEEEENNNKKFKGDLHYGLDPGQSRFTIPEIVNKRGDIPREDGHIWTIEEKTERRMIANELPYQEKWFNEIEERQKILRKDPNYKFLKLVAGNMDVEVFELFDEEDINRLVREQQDIRERLNLERKRTIVGIDKKYTQLQILDKLIQDENNNLLFKKVKRPNPHFIKSIGENFILSFEGATGEDHIYDANGGFIFIVDLIKTYSTIIDAWKLYKKMNDPDSDAAMLLMLNSTRTLHENIKILIGLDSVYARELSEAPIEQTPFVLKKGENSNLTNLKRIIEKNIILYIFMIIYRDFLDLSQKGVYVQNILLKGTKRTDDFGYVLSLFDILKRCIKYSSKYITFKEDVVNYTGFKLTKQEIHIERTKEKDKFIDKTVKDIDEPTYKHDLKDDRREKLLLESKTMTEREWDLFEQQLTVGMNNGKERLGSEIDTLKEWYNATEIKSSSSSIIRLRQQIKSSNPIQTIQWETLRGFNVINLNIFTVLFGGDISKYKEIAKIGCNKYLRKHKNYCDFIISNISSNGAIRQTIIPTDIRNDAPKKLMNILITGVGRGWNEKEIIVIAFSHFMALYFTKTEDWKEIIDVFIRDDENKDRTETALAYFYDALVADRTETYDNNIPLTLDTLIVIRDLYKDSMSEYFWKISKFFSKLSIIQFSKDIEENIIKNFNHDTFINLNEALRRFPLTSSIIDRDFEVYVGENLNKNKKIYQEKGYLDNNHYPILLLHVYLELYFQYIESGVNESNKKLIELKESHEKTKKIIESISGDERGLEKTSKQRSKLREMYTPTKSWTFKPENSGIIEIKDGIVSAISDAYDLVQTYAIGLRGIPLIEIQKSLNNGLASTFAKYVAVIISDNRLVYTRQYNKDIEFKKVAMNKFNIMKRLKMYKYSRSGRGYTTRQMDQSEYNILYQTRGGGGEGALGFNPYNVSKAYREPILLEDGTVGTTTIIML